MTQDEGRFGRINIPKSSWAPKGIRPKVAKQIVRNSIYVYSAVVPQSGQLLSLVLPYCNTEMMSIFLEYISKEFSNNSIIMQVDGAGWHKSKSLIIPDNIYFIFQPPYSPEVNPTEHIWEELREKYLQNKVYKSIDETIYNVCKGLKEMSCKPKMIKSMTNFPYLNFLY